MRCINKSNLSKKCLNLQPFQWGVFSNLILNEFKDDLISQYPSRGFVKNSRLEGDRKHYQFQVLKLVERSLITSNFQVLSDLWRNFIQDLYSKQYIDLVCQILNIPTGQYFIDIGLFKYDKGDWVSPHLDHPKKAFTQLFYFNENWDDLWGGLLLLHTGPGFDKVFRFFPPIVETSILFKCDNAWHSVTPVTNNAQKERLSLQIEAWKE